MPSCEDSSGLTEVDRNEIMNHGTLNFTGECENLSPCSSSPSTSTSESSESDAEGRRHSFSSPIIEQLVSLGLLWETGDQGSKYKMMSAMLCASGRDLDPEKMVKSFQVTSEYIQCLDQLTKLTGFVRNYLQSQMIGAANHLHRVSQKIPVLISY
jgi:hypothetical protein